LHKGSLHYSLGNQDGFLLTEDRETLVKNSICLNWSCTATWEIFSHFVFANLGNPPKKNYFVILTELT
jgi:hypothetical protein